MEFSQNNTTDGGQTVSTCQALMQNCKQEAKHLLEANVTNRKIHWTHPSFISFCTSVDDILSYGVHKKYRTLNTTSKQWLTSSGRVLQELSKAFPVAASMYNMCYSSNGHTNERSAPSRPKPDYASLQSDSRSEYKILWIRTAILEKTLKPIVDEILRKPELYYSKKSVLCHSVFSELFSFLLDGPCSLNFSRMRSIDTSVISPAPSEIINRYSRVFPTSSLGYATYQQDSLNSEVWGHIQSLYQTSVTTCLYGKNNIMMTPPNYSYPLEGYLTLIQFESSLLLKWLPNALINRKFEDTSPERFHILSLDITNDVAHIHCHQSNESEIIMIGYNGIGYPALSFPQPLSLTHFLESLENGLHPRGCLEPPLWFLRQQLHSPEKSSKPATSPQNEDGYPKIWNQVFRVRFGRLKQQDNGLPVQEVVEWDEVSDKEGSSPERHGETANLRRSRSKSPLKSIRVGGSSYTKKRIQSSSNELERLQSKVSHQLVARYFYSWLSYCRHINRIKTSLSHLVTKPAPYVRSSRQVEDNVAEPLPLSERDWAEFTSLRTNAAWGKVVWRIYGGGVTPSLRKEVWPYLLNVYSSEATETEVSEAIKRNSEGYQNTLQLWKELERKHYRNNDPTSTSMDIRLGLTTPTSTSHHQPETAITTHHIINTAGDDGPDLIELGSNNDEDEELLVVTDTDVPVEDVVVPVGVPVDSTVIPVTSNGVPLLDEADADSGCEDRPHTGTSSEGEGLHGAILFSGDTEVPEPTLAPNEEKFLEELLKIDKDIPRCDRDYWYFQDPSNLTKLRNVISSYIWRNIDGGYSQGMCDLLAPLLVTFDNEEMSFICFEKLMQTMDYYFPPKPGVQDRMNNLRSLLQILESDFFQYLSELPMGDSLFYSYRWFLVNFKREFSYDDIFLLWETSWSAKWCSTEHFEVFVAMAIIQQYKSAIMDAQLDASEILNLFTDLSEKKEINYSKTVSYAQSVISHVSQQDSSYV